MTLSLVGNSQRAAKGDMALAPSISRRAFHKEIAAYLRVSTTAGLAGPLARHVCAADRLNFPSIWLNDPEFIGYTIAIDNGYYAASDGLSNWTTPFYDLRNGI